MDFYRLMVVHELDSIGDEEEHFYLSGTEAVKELSSRIGGDLLNSQGVWDGFDNQIVNINLTDDDGYNVFYKVEKIHAK